MNSLVRHSGLYAVARIVAGLTTLATLSLYTRWLAPEEFGRYALAITTVTLTRVAFFYWLRIAVLRMLPPDAEMRRRFLSSVAAGFVLSCAISVPFAAVLALTQDARLVALGLILLWSFGWFDLSLDLLRADLNPQLYGLSLAWRSVLVLGLGSAGVVWMGKAEGALIGAILGTLAPGPGSRAMFSSWRVVRRAMIELDQLRELSRFGLPPTAAVALALVIGLSDRLFLAWLDGAHAAGLYSASYDLAQNAVAGLLLPISLASFPLAVRAYETQGPSAGARAIESNLVLMALVGFPVALALGTLAPNIAHVLLGAEFRHTATRVLPWVAVAGFMASLIELHLNRAFQLTKRAGKQVAPYAVAAVLNVVLNVWWIPLYGIMGAVTATLVAYVVAVALAHHEGRKVLPTGTPWSALSKITLSTALMVGALFPLRDYLGGPAMLAQVLVGIAVYSSTLALLTREASPLRAVRALLGQ